MEPITLITTALIFGATEMGKGALGEVGKNAYQSLKSLLLQHFAGDVKAERALADHEQDPDTYEKPLAKALQQAGVERDAEVLKQAEALLAAADPVGSAQGKYITINGPGQVGNYNTQNINMGSPPPTH